MKLLSAVLSLLALGGVSPASDTEWQELPELPDKFGFAGPFVGVHEGALIVAGGANFPKQPLWETDKVWHDRIFALPSDGEGARWKLVGRLPRSLAYGAAVSTPDGVLCLGGDDSQQVYGETFLLSWDPQGQEIERIEYPPLPRPVAYGAAALVDGFVYLVAGQQGKALGSATAEVWSYDLSRGAGGGWRALADIPLEVASLCAGCQSTQRL